jgi:hypothetical protein
MRQVKISDAKDFCPFIRVTADVLNTAKRSNSSHCAIADAIKEHLPDARFVSVDLQTIRFSRGTKRFIYLTPRSAQQLIVDFDQGRTLKSFGFQLKNAQVIISRPVDPKTRSHPRKTKTEIVSKDPGNGTPYRRNVRKVGGKAPPRLPAQRRVFGIKGLLK